MTPGRKAAADDLKVPLPNIITRVCALEMSSVYSMEPRPNGKVTLNTTYGPLCVELWGKECPLACRNFIQLCLEGYYDKTPFHRLVPGFCLQGGSGAVAEQSIYPNDPFFGVETHSRLKFNRRGLLGMVALDPSNLKSTHATQFFFTLSEAPELNGKATLFGRLVGDTIFNLLRMSELEVDPKTELLLYPPKITSTQVILNPFDDIIPRETLKKDDTKNIPEPDPSGTIKIDKLKKRNTSLLSFADDEENDDISKSKLNIKKQPPSNSDSKTRNSEPVLSSNNTSTSIPTSNNNNSNNSNASSLQFLQQMKAVQMRETQDKIKEMEEELGLRPKNVAIERSDDDKTSKDKPEKPLSALEKYKARFSEKQRSKKDEMDTILMLNAFRQKIQKVAEPEVEKKHLDICKLHGLINCPSCQDTFSVNLNKEAEDFDEKDWMMHKLVFDRCALEGQIRDDLRELVVIDPREQAEKMTKQKK